MNPRYQIFISSTFRDLKEERQAVLDAVLAMEHFPTGMEIFPAANATPWSLIESIIKESDYYVLIVGGMYGSTDENGVGYTEREYDLAVEFRLPILAFLHKDPESIPHRFSERTPEASHRLAAFRKKVEKHHCKYWKNPDELKSHVIIGLTHEFRESPRVGWVRGDKSEDPETLKKLTTAMEENVQLQNQLKELREVLGTRSADGEGFSSGKDPLALQYQMPDKTSGEIETTWDDVFCALAQDIITERPEYDCKHFISVHIALRLIDTGRATREQMEKTLPSVTGESFNRIKYQFIALGYIEPFTFLYRGSADLVYTKREQGWKLTHDGVRALAAKRAIRKPAVSIDA